MPCGSSRATLICFSLINHTRLHRTRYGFVVVVVVEVDGGAGGGVTTVVDDDGGTASTTGAGLSSTCLWYEKHPVAIAHAAITAGIVTIRCISRIFLNPPSGIYP